MTEDLRSRLSAVRGANYVPSTAASDTQFWAEFDQPTIETELGYASDVGLNSVRVFLQYLVFENEPDSMLERFHTFCSIADDNGLSVLPVFFDDCFGPEPELGPFPDPVPGVHNSRWRSSPGRTRMSLSYRSALRRYVDAFITSFREDPRVLAWEIYNEPKSEPPTLALQRDAFAWARSIGPRQPLTACWSGTYHSDVTNVHLYTSPTQQPEEVARTIEAAESFDKPVLVTEFLGRPNRGTLPETLPIFSDHGFGWYFWELMIARTQVDIPWKRDADIHPDGVAFQGLLYPDGTPYDPNEIDLLKFYANLSPR